MTYFYIYKITCTKGRWKNHYYIGQHKTDKMDDGYKGSSAILNKSYYPKHPNDYIKEILCFCNDADELNAAEDFYIGDKYETDPLCVNLKAGGNQATLSDEIRQQISETLKGRTLSDETRKKQSEAMKGENNPMYGKTRSEETRKKQSETTKSAMTVEIRQKMSEAHKGKKLSDETRKKQSEANKGVNNPMYGKTHSDETRKKQSEAKKGKHWYNNGTTQLRAFECPIGYVAGRLR